MLLEAYVGGRRLGTCDRWWQGNRNGEVTGIAGRGIGEKVKVVGRILLDVCASAMLMSDQR